MEKADKIDVYDKWNSTKWYNHTTFSLIPVFIVKKKDKMNNTNYLFKWLFIQAWTGDSFILGLSLFFNFFKGIGISLQLPYLYIECSYRNNTVIYRILSLLNRKTELSKMNRKEKEEFFKKESEEQKEFLFKKINESK